jgi:hypothetical protein
MSIIYAYWAMLPVGDLLGKNPTTPRSEPLAPSVQKVNVEPIHACLSPHRRVLGSCYFRKQNRCRDFTYHIPFKKKPKILFPFLVSPALNW